MFFMRTRVSCGQGIGWRARKGEDLRAVLGNATIANLAITESHFITRNTCSTLARIFRTDGCVGVAIPTVGIRASLSLYGPQNACCFRLPLLPVVGITPVTKHCTIILTDQMVHHPASCARCPYHAHRMYEPAFSIDADVCSCQYHWLPFFERIRDRALRPVLRRR